MSRSARRPQRKSIGPYEIVSELAATCAVGTLWLGAAHDGPRIGEPLLFRRLPSDLEVATAVDEATRGVLEIPVHDGVLPLVGLERDDDEVVIASDYVEGEMLSVVLRAAGLARRAMPPEVALRIVADVLEALRHVHGAGLMVAPTPETVWVGRDGRARLLEPGIHPVFGSTPPWSESPRRLAYEAPEGPRDPRSDVFSLGVIAWEMLKNRPLFAGPTAEAVRSRVRTAGIRRLDAMPGGERIDAALADLVESTLGREPEERLTPDAFASLLRGFLLAETWDVGAFLEDLCAEHLARQQRLVDAVVHAPRSGPPPASKRPGALISTRPPGSAASMAPPSLDDTPSRRTFDEALVVSPDSFSPTSSPREALDSFETLVASEGLSHEPDDDELSALDDHGAEASWRGVDEPPESERRLRARALELEALEPVSEPPHDAPPESGRRRASSAPPESGRRRASGAYLELPAAATLPPSRPRRNLAPMLFGGLVAVVSIVIGLLLLARDEPAPSTDTAAPAEEPPVAPSTAPSAGGRAPNEPDKEKRP